MVEWCNLNLCALIRSALNYYRLLLKRQGQRSIFPVLEKQGHKSEGTDDGSNLTYFFSYRVYVDASKGLSVF